jgi:hypothetical protein
MANRKPLRFFLLKLVLPLVYAGFFIVQLFINFDSALSPFSGRYQIVHCPKEVIQSATLKKPTGSQPVKTKFRLNKRFQPAVIAALADIRCEPIVRFVSSLRVRYANPYIKDLVPDTRLLRGPPFAA